MTHPTGQHGAPVAPPTDVDVRSARDAVAAGMRAMGLASGAFLIPLAIAPLVPLELHLHGRVPMSTWLLLVAEAWVLLGLLLRHRSRALLLASGFLGLAATLWWMPHRHEPGAFNWWAPGFWAIPWTCWAVTLLSRRAFALLTGAGLVVLTVAEPLDLHLRHLPITPLSMAPMGWFTAPVAMMALFGYGLEKLAVQADHQSARRRAAQRSQATERATGDARREAARLLHDHVLHALHAISREVGRVPTGMVVDECRAAVAAVEQARHAQPLALLGDLVREDPAVAASGALVEGDVRPLPHEVARAMAAATHEALSNVARHAHARQVVVRLWDQGSTWNVAVEDDGRGFDTARVITLGRLGLARSVHERLEDAGGRADVTSSPGAGTRVHLVWPALADQPESSLWPRMGDLTMGRALARTSWPMLAVTPLMAWSCGGLLTPSWPMRVVGMLLLAMGIGYQWQVRRRPLGPGGIATIMVSTTLAWWLNLWLAPGQPEVIYTLWIAWTAAALVHLAVMQVSFWRGLVLLLGWNLLQWGGLLLAYGPAGALRLEASLATGLAEGCVALVALRVARHVVDENAAQARVAEALHRSAGRLQARSHVEEFWSARVTDVALPLLRRVAAGQVDLRDPAVHDQAHQLEAVLRDELVIGPGHADLLNALHGLRQQGWTVRSMLTDDVDPSTLDSFTAHLQHFGPPTRPGQLMTLSTSGTQGMIVVLGATEEQSHRWRSCVESLGGACEVDPDFVRVSLPRSAPVPEYVI